MSLGRSAAPLAGVRKIAVLRANGIGDFIFVLPALAALRATYSEAEIVLLGRGWHAEFLTDRLGPVDRVVVVPPSRGIGEGEAHDDDPLLLDAFFAAMRQENFDLAFQLHGGGRHSNPFVRRLGARLTVGLKGAEAVPLDRWVPYLYYQHEVLRLLEVVGLAGATTGMVEPRLAVTATDLHESRRIVPVDAAPLAVLHPGAGDPRRRWPSEKFAIVGDALVRAGARLVVTGTPDEAAVVASVVAAMRSPAQDLCGRLSLGGLAGLLARGAVVVSNDSGPLHLAAAVGAATVGLYWCGNLINAGPLTRSRHRPFLSWRLACPVCGLDCTQSSCSHRDSFVADIPVDEVIAAALDLLAMKADSDLAQDGLAVGG